MINTKYAEYLVSPEWSQKRKETLELKGTKCQRCTNNINIHIHHATYENIYNEDVKNDLFVLCNSCHDEYHRKNKVVSIESTIKFIKVKKVKYLNKLLLGGKCKNCNGILHLKNTKSWRYLLVCNKCTFKCIAIIYGKDMII